MSIGTMRRWAKTGQIRHVVTPSGRIRFHAVDLDKALELVERKTATPA